MTITRTHLSTAALEHHVQGQNLAGATFADNLATRPTLLVFLRHFG
jgi:hypothetical protein